MGDTRLSIHMVGLKPEPNEGVRRAFSWSRATHRLATRRPSPAGTRRASVAMRARRILYRCAATCRRGSEAAELRRARVRSIVARSSGAALSDRLGLDPACKAPISSAYTRAGLSDHLIPAPGISVTVPNTGGLDHAARCTRCGTLRVGCMGCLRTARRILLVAPLQLLVPDRGSTFSHRRDARMLILFPREQTTDLQKFIQSCCCKLRGRGGVRQRCRSARHRRAPCGKRASRSREPAAYCGEFCREAKLAGA